MNPFRNYTPVLDATAIKREAKASKTASANREAGMRSEDPERRFAATGTMPHLKASPTKADKSNSRM